MACAMLTALREREFQKKKTYCPLYLLLQCCRCVFWLRLYGCRRQSVPGDINKFERCFLGSVRVFVWCSEGLLAPCLRQCLRALRQQWHLGAGSVSDVINSRSGLVITPRCSCSEVVVRAACTLTTTSLVLAAMCGSGCPLGCQTLVWRQ